MSQLPVVVRLPSAAGPERVTARSQRLGLADVFGVVAFVSLAVGSDPFSTASGDWHDAIPLPKGRMAMVVGDALGRGRHAEPLKRLLRDAARRLTLMGAPPEAVLAKLRGAIAAYDHDGLATVLYAVVDSGSGELTMLNAGHPPPLLVAPDGKTTFLAGPVAPPLGAPWPDGEPLPCVARMRPGDTLLLYTDGLIERRDLDLTAGLDRLAVAASRNAGATLADLAERLLQLGFAEGAPTDDLTVTAIRLCGDRPGAPPGNIGNLPRRPGTPLAASSASPLAQG